MGGCRVPEVIPRFGAGGVGGWTCDLGLSQEVPASDECDGCASPCDGLWGFWWGVKRGGGNLPGSGFRGRSFGGGSVLEYLVGNAGRVAAAPQGACA